jgi:hypothetical protein
VTEKLIKRICGFLPMLDPARVKLLYNLRSDAVHGRYFDEQQMNDAISLTNDILRNAIIKSIETNSKTLPDWE